MSTMGYANLSTASEFTLMPKIIEVKAYSPAFFLLKSLTDIYFYLKKLMNFYI